MEKQLNIGDVLSNGIKIGLKNFFPLLGALILYFITIWIPYINVGTTIAIFTIPTLLSKGESINPLDIFNQRYRKCMGEFLLTYALMFLIIMMGIFFLLVPGLVMGIAYSFSLYLVVDKGKGASDALKISNQITYGHKWTIFLVMFILMLGVSVLSVIAGFFSSDLLIWIMIVITLLIYPIIMGASGYMYGVLASDIEDEKEWYISPVIQI